MVWLRALKALQECNDTRKTLTGVRFGLIKSPQKEFERKEIVDVEKEVATKSGDGV